MNKPKILLFDIENSPSSAYIWSLYTEVISESMIENSWYMLCWAAKWLGEDKVYSSALIDFPKEYKKNKENDKLILQKLWKLLDEADIIVAHNGKKFDVRKVNARFIMNNFPPPSPYKVVDTLQAARQYFYFTSNRLDDLGKYLGVGEKLDTGGFKLWKQCMSGDKKAWKKMVDYCKNDIILLENVYLKLRPFIENHPSLTVYMNEEEHNCPKCGSEKVVKEGFSYTNACQYQRYSCKDCHGWSRGKTNLKKKENAQ